MGVFALGGEFCTSCLEDASVKCSFCSVFFHVSFGFYVAAPPSLVYALFSTRLTCQLNAQIAYYFLICLIFLDAFVSDRKGPPVCQF